MDIAKKFIVSREKLVGISAGKQKQEAEGGCGVLGMISTVPVKGRHLLAPSKQMRNRGNGKGGGIAAVGLQAGAFGVDDKILQDDYLITIAYLDESSIVAVEKDFILGHFDAHHKYKFETVSDYREIPGLEIKPPEAISYFCRVKPEVLARFVSENKLEGISPEDQEDEFVYQNSYNLNKTFYASLGDKKAFVLSHGKNLIVLKIVGYAEQVFEYYKLQDFAANVWISHQRYPTKGRVWHPGGAHPFVGLHEALVHNGDFANYYGVCQYLKQRNIYPLFLTDTEVSVLLFDLYKRLYRYPLEYVIEALAPTTERDFLMLPEEKKKLYRKIQISHMHASPDGPWFFIIARNDPHDKAFQLVGITDTSMLRPQVFAIHEGETQIGIIASEKQAIDALLESVSTEIQDVCPVADRYWNARGGSHTDGGAFIFSITHKQPYKLVCANKFGDKMEIKQTMGSSDQEQEKFRQRLQGLISNHDTNSWLDSLVTLTELRDIRYRTTFLQRKRYIASIDKSIEKLLSEPPDGNIVEADFKSKELVDGTGEVLLINASDFPAEGNESLSMFIVQAVKHGFKRMIIFNCRGQRFIGCGLGPDSEGVRIDVYGSSGDYLGSGLDGAHIYVHNNAQDQVGQILKMGKLVIYGDTGQTFLYGAKGGEIYLLGNAAGRPLINAVGSPRVVINGSCLDYLAESFMAGDPLNGGGFVILNGLQFDDQGEIYELETPYPGSNLFSLASGGAIYIRDPHKKVDEEQLNGGRFTHLTEKDWQVIFPYLKENERLFGIRVEEILLNVNGVKKSQYDVYRKVEAVKEKVLT